MPIDDPISLSQTTLSNLQFCPQSTTVKSALTRKSIAVKFWSNFSKRDWSKERGTQHLLLVKVSPKQSTNLQSKLVNLKSTLRSNNPAVNAGQSAQKVSVSMLVTTACPNKKFPTKIVVKRCWEKYSEGGGVNQCFELTSTFQFLILIYVRYCHLGNQRMYTTVVNANRIYPDN